MNIYFIFTIKYNFYYIYEVTIGKFVYKAAIIIKLSLLLIKFIQNTNRISNIKYKNKIYCYKFMHCIFK